MYSDVLINKLAQRYDGAVKEDETETRKAFADAHAASGRVPGEPYTPTFSSRSGAVPKTCPRTPL